MDEKISTQEEILRVLASMAPPNTPDEVFTDPDLRACERWQKEIAAAQVAGLQTDPRLHANGIRLDWLQRLVLSKARGTHRPTPQDLEHVLNKGMTTTRVAHLEDPSEDLFCELIATERGNFRIFPGQWEKAGAFTQTLLVAFHALPEAPQKDAALSSAYALLKLSDALAARAGVDRFTEFSRSPLEDIPVPEAGGLSRMATRVRFSLDDLATLDISSDHIDEYVLAPHLHEQVSDREIGDTPLEFFPLIRAGDDYIVASPPNLSLAVRATLISTAKNGGVERAFLRAIMAAQEEFSDNGHFWPLRGHLHLSPPNRHNMRGSVVGYAPGHFLQIIQVVTGFGSFPQQAFGSMYEFSEAELKFLGAQFEGFWSFLEGQDDVRGAAPWYL